MGLATVMVTRNTSLFLRASRSKTATRRAPVIVLSADAVEAPFGSVADPVGLEVVL